MLNKNGAVSLKIDSGVGTNGKVVIRTQPSTVLEQEVNHPETRIKGVAVQSDGKIVIVADSCPQGNQTQCDIAIARLQPGALAFDPSFGAEGFSLSHFGMTGNHVHSIAMQADGKILLGGEADGDFALLRLMP